jgi:Arc/MetJ-type ribon-helix-helix transcriptional regulator
MTIQLPDDLERFVIDEVKAGRYPSEVEVVRAALEQLRRQTVPVGSGLGSIGAMHDDAELLDRAVAHVFKVREERPWRLGLGE